MNVWNSPDGWTARATIGSFVATALLWLFTAFLWWTTRRAVRDQEKVLEVAIRSAEAAEIAANAALASLDRPWLVIEGMKHNEKDWLNYKEMWISEFHITNYGKAPAFLKGLKLVSFRGPPTRGDAPFTFPTDVKDFPTADSFGRFIWDCGRPPMIEGLNAPKPGISDEYGSSSKKVFVPAKDRSFVVPGGGRSETLCTVGYIKLEDSGQPGINFMRFTEGYFLGQIVYEIPGGLFETMTFCFRSDQNASFNLYRDLAPYNERRKSLGADEARK